SLEMAQASGELRRVHGLVTADGGELRAAGMSRDYAWKSARANLDWDAAGVRLQDLRVAGDGIELAGQATLAGPPAALVAKGTFHARGRVRVRNQQAVARLAEALAYRSPLGGGWSAGEADFEVDATGPLASSGDVVAAGRFTVRDLALRPQGADAPIRLQRIAGDFHRDPKGLKVGSLMVEASGVQGTGTLNVANQAGVPGAGTSPDGDARVRFTADGKVRVGDPTALRRLMPNAAMW